MKLYMLVLFFMSSFIGQVRSQGSEEMLDLSKEVYDAYNDLVESIDHLNTVHGALADIAQNKAPVLANNNWSKLAESYRITAEKLKEAPLPTAFEKVKYAVSMNDLQNCSLKESNLHKMQGYLQELRDAQIRAIKSMTELDDFKTKIKISKDLLSSCSTFYQKLAGVPLLGETFQWNWLELDTDVSESLAILKNVVTLQKKQINEEKSKIDLYVSNLESSISLMSHLLEKNCGLKHLKVKTRSLATVNPSDRKVEKGFFIFLTADVYINDHLTTIISVPFLHTAKLTDAMTYEKNEFIKQVNLQLPSKPDNLTETLTENKYQAISIHYSKPYSLELLKSEKAGYDAIAGFKNSLITTVQGLSYSDRIAFYQLGR